MNSYIWTYLLPLVTCVLLSGPFRFREKVITRLSTLSLLIPALSSLLLLWDGMKTGIFPREILVGSFSVFEHVFPVVIWVDKYTIAFLALTHLLGLLVVKYSHGYLHLEKGYQRFFSTIQFFIFGMYTLSFAGTMDLFFAGWEVVGFSSFLLIAFYRSHNRSVQNAWRIYNIYRLCDIGLLMGAVMGHILWHEATRFSVLNTLSKGDFATANATGLLIISLLLILATLGKSAQFPFHSWPSRAMEGPTPSSAIFYGALSIHAGVFLLIRTYPIWTNHLATQILVGVIGFLTLILSSLQGRVQSNIKGQIAFASTAQIGLMFIELSLGLEELVMIHMVCHALYRCFQLLVSPSIVANSLGRRNVVVMGRLGSRRSFIDKLPRSMQRSLYVLSMSDFFMDISWRGFGFLPWRRLYHGVNILFIHWYFTLPMVSIGISLTGSRITSSLILSAIGLFFSLRSFLLHDSSFQGMRDLALSLVLGLCSLYLLEQHFGMAVISYSVSVVPCLAAALWIAWKYRHYDMRNFHGIGTKHSWDANIFFICFMVLAGMPVSTAFFGEDVILEELITQSLPIAVMTAINLMANGFVCVKIYTRIFMGLPPAIKE